MLFSLLVLVVNADVGNRIPNSDTKYPGDGKTFGRAIGMKRTNTWIFPILILFLTACKTGVAAPETTDIASAAAVARSLATVDPEASLHLFEYDRQSPMDIQEKNRWHEGNATWVDFTYTSPKGGSITARLVIPDGKGPFPGIILQHGGGGRASLEDLTYQAQAFAGYGAVVMMITDPYSRPGGWEVTQYMGNTWPLFTSRDLEIKIQLIVDLRRAIDILSSRPDVDPERLAYYGVSFGGAMGGLLAGVEDRLVAYVLVVGDGGLVEHTADPGENGRNIHFSQNWADLMWPTESLHFVGRAAPAALLFQNGIYDTFVPPHDAIRYQTAASQPKTILWYDSDHGLPWKHVVDAARWLQPYLGSRLLLLAPNYRASAQWFERALILLEAASLGVFVWLVTRKPRLRWSDRLTWLPAVILLGPLGLALFWVSNRPTTRSKAPNLPPRLWKIALGTAALTTGALMVGVFTGDQINNFIHGDFRIRLIQLYLSIMVVGWLLSRSARGYYQTSISVYIPVTNLIWGIVMLTPFLIRKFSSPPVWMFYLVEACIGMALTTIIFGGLLWHKKAQDNGSSDRILAVKWTRISKLAAAIFIAITSILAFGSTLVMLKLVTGFGWREVIMILGGVY